MEEIKESKEKTITPEIIRTILQEGVDFEVTLNRKTFFKRKSKKFKIYPINLGTLFNISKIILTMKEIETLDSEDLFAIGVKNITENKDKILEIIALGILNRRVSTFWMRYKKWGLMRYLNDNLSPNELLKILQLIIAQMDVTDFLASIVSVKRLNLTEARNKENTSIIGKSSAA